MLGCLQVYATTLLNFESLHHFALELDVIVLKFTNQRVGLETSLKLTFVFSQIFQLALDLYI